MSNLCVPAFYTLDTKIQIQLKLYFNIRLDRYRRHKDYCFLGNCYYLYILYLLIELILEILTSDYQFLNKVKPRTWYNLGSLGAVEFIAYTWITGSGVYRTFSVDSHNRKLRLSHPAPSRNTPWTNTPS